MSLLPSHWSTILVPIADVDQNAVDVDMDVALVVVSHLLHVLSHPPGAIRVSHKPLANIDWHDNRGSVFALWMQRSVVVVVVTVVLVLIVVVVAVVEVLVVVLVEVVYVVVLVLELVDVEVLVVVVSHPLHVLSHSPGTLAHNP